MPSCRSARLRAEDVVLPRISSRGQGPDQGQSQETSRNGAKTRGNEVLSVNPGHVKFFWGRALQRIAPIKIWNRSGERVGFRIAPPQTNIFQVLCTKECLLNNLLDHVQFHLAPKTEVTFFVQCHPPGGKGRHKVWVDCIEVQVGGQPGIKILLELLPSVDWFVLPKFIFLPLAPLCKKVQTKLYFPPPRDLNQVCNFTVVSPASPYFKVTPTKGWIGGCGDGGIKYLTISFFAQEYLTLTYVLLVKLHESDDEPREVHIFGRCVPNLISQALRTDVRQIERLACEILHPENPCKTHKSSSLFPPIHGPGQKHHGQGDSEVKSHPSSKLRREWEKQKRHCEAAEARREKRRRAKEAEEESRRAKKRAQELEEHAAGIQKKIQDLQDKLVEDLQYKQSLMTTQTQEADDMKLQMELNAREIDSLFSISPSIMKDYRNEMETLRGIIGKINRAMDRLGDKLHHLYPWLEQLQDEFNQEGFRILGELPQGRKSRVSEVMEVIKVKEKQDEKNDPAQLTAMLSLTRVDSPAKLWDHLKEMTVSELLEHKAEIDSGFKEIPEKFKTAKIRQVREDVSEAIDTLIEGLTDIKDDPKGERRAMKHALMRINREIQALQKKINQDELETLQKKFNETARKLLKTKEKKPRDLARTLMITPSLLEQHKPLGSSKAFGAQSLADNRPLSVFSSISSIYSSVFVSISGMELQEHQEKIAQEFENVQNKYQHLQTHEEFSQVKQDITDYLKSLRSQVDEQDREKERLLAEQAKMRLTRIHSAIHKVQIELGFNGELADLQGDLHKELARLLGISPDSPAFGFDPLTNNPESWNKANLKKLQQLFPDTEQLIKHLATINSEFQQLPENYKTPAVQQTQKGIDDLLKKLIASAEKEKENAKNRLQKINDLVDKVNDSHVGKLQDLFNDAFNKLLNLKGPDNLLHSKRQAKETDLERLGKFQGQFAEMSPKELKELRDKLNQLIKGLPQNLQDEETLRNLQKAVNAFLDKKLDLSNLKGLLKTVNSEVDNLQTYLQDLNIASLQDGVNTEFNSLLQLHASAHLRKKTLNTNVEPAKIDPKEFEQLRQNINRAIDKVADEFKKPTLLKLQDAINALADSILDQDINSHRNAQKKKDLIQTLKDLNQQLDKLQQIIRNQGIHSLQNQTNSEFNALLNLNDLENELLKLTSKPLDEPELDKAEILNKIPLKELQNYKKILNNLLNQIPKKNKSPTVKQLQAAINNLLDPLIVEGLAKQKSNKNCADERDRLLLQQQRDRINEAIGKLQEKAQHVLIGRYQLGINEEVDRLLQQRHDFDQDPTKFCNFGKASGEKLTLSELKAHANAINQEFNKIPKKYMTSKMLKMRDGINAVIDQLREQIKLENANSPSGRLRNAIDELESKVKAAIRRLLGEIIESAKNFDVRGANKCDIDQLYKQKFLKQIKQLKDMVRLEADRLKTSLWMEKEVRNKFKLLQFIRRIEDVAETNLNWTNEKLQQLAEKLKDQAKAAKIREGAERIRKKYNKVFVVPSSSTMLGRKSGRWRSGYGTSTRGSKTNFNLGTARSSKGKMYPFPSALSTTAASYAGLTKGSFLPELDCATRSMVPYDVNLDKCQPNMKTRLITPRDCTTKSKESRLEESKCGFFLSDRSAEDLIKVLERKDKESRKTK